MLGEEGCIYGCLNGCLTILGAIIVIICIIILTGLGVLYLFENLL
jgi:hypothetical protein